MEMIPRLTPDTLPDAALAAGWRADGVTLVHLMLDKLDGAEASVAALRDAGFAVQVEMTDPALAEEAAVRLCGAVERLFVPFDLLARPRCLQDLLERWGKVIGVSVQAEEGAVYLPLPGEAKILPYREAVRTLAFAGVCTILYRDVAAECLPLGQVADIAERFALDMTVAGHLNSRDDLLALAQMGLTGWLCPPVLMHDAMRVLRRGERG